MISDPPLLAKSERKENGHLKPGCYLLQHSIDVVDAAMTILRVLEKDLTRFFKLDESQITCLRSTSLLTALWHDIGKANDGFQKMVKKTGAQLIRHEHLSALLMSLTNVRAWLEKIPHVDYELARLVIAGYHLQLADEGNTDKRFLKFAERMSREGESFALCAEHSDFNEILRLLCLEPFGLKASDFDFAIPLKWSFSSSASGEQIRSHRNAIISEFSDLVDDLEVRPERLRLLMATKAVLIAADAAASGLRRREGDTEIPIGVWVEEKLSSGCNAKDIQTLIRKRIAEITIRKRRKDPLFKFSFHNFQKKTRLLGGRALLLSSCGSGKTLAAYLWIRKQLRSRPNWKVAFLYPTTNTAAQGFKDYASHNEKATLVSSRAEFDLDGMFENPDERSGHDYSTDNELYALGYWPKHIFSSTVDAFLGFTQNNYSSLCLLPVLTRSIVVIDEVHSFDPAMFSALLEFLEKFDVPVLMMTASLQTGRLECLQKKFPELQTYPQKDDFNKDLTDLRDANRFERYWITFRNEQWAKSEKEYCPIDLLDIVRKAHERRRKVLWVVNTVDRCIRIAQQLRDLEAYCYHSRFMYEDRVDMHEAVVEKFASDDELGVVAVTTQVCEMSLDLNADILITELCPASSLIQRMGRCNRNQVGKDAKEHGQVFIYQPPMFNKLPYQDEEYDTGIELLSKLNTTALTSQEALADALVGISSRPERIHACKFTMPTWKSYCENDFRETDEFSVAAVLESELDEYRHLKREKKSVEGIILQAPIRYTEKEKREGIWPRVVPNKQMPVYKYCKQYGLRKDE